MSELSPPSTPRRLHWGCGPNVVDGWINADREPQPGLHIERDIRDGLPLADGSMDCVVAIHALQDLPWRDIVPALKELRRVLRPGGVLRLGLPDMDRAIDAYRRGDGGYFVVPDDDARSVGAKLVTQLIWYGSTRTPMTFDYVQEQLAAAGFGDIRRCDFGRSDSGIAGLASLDDRERESLFVEATA